MPRVFVYEFLTAHGIGRDPASPDHGMYREGRAMREAIETDFRRLDGFDVWSFPDEAVPIERDWLLGMAAASDYAIVVAPETDRCLEFAIEPFQHGQLLGPSLPAVRLTADKFALGRHWASNGVRTPFTATTAMWPVDRVPVLFKLRDGAGSCEMRLSEDPQTSRRMIDRYESGETPEFIAQDFVPGRPASVAFLIGPSQTVPLLPTFQRLSADGRFQYLGGELPIPPALAERAVALGRRAVECVPGLGGYVGVDLVLGEAADGSQDYAIEINPRLTTSYVGLRALSETNLAGAMLDVCAGRPVEPIRWKPGRVRFEPDGTVEYDPTPGVGWE